MRWLPPLPTLLLTGALGVGGVAAAIQLKPVSTSAIQATASQTSDVATASSAPTVWPGPRPETRRDILIAPLFAQDRKLPPPFSQGKSPALADPTPPNKSAPKTVSAAPAPAAPAPVSPAPEPVEPTEIPQKLPPVPSDLPELHLIGTFIANDLGIARALLIEVQGGSEEVWVDKDGKYADWVLTVVSPDAVHLEAGAESVTLEMWEEEEDVR